MTDTRYCAHEDCPAAGEPIPAGDGDTFRGRWYCDGCSVELLDFEQDEPRVGGRLLAELVWRR